MGIKKIAGIFASFLLLATVFTGNANASEWYSCSINAVGAGSGNANSANTMMMVALTADNGAFSSLWVTIDGTYASEALATVLTAKALGKKIYVNLNDTNNATTANGFYLID